jgi:hypothetical protein
MFTTRQNMPDDLQNRRAAGHAVAGRFNPTYFRQSFPLSRQIIAELLGLVPKHSLGNGLGAFVVGGSSGTGRPKS